METENKKLNGEFEIDLLALLKALWHRAFLIIFVACIFAVCAYVATTMLVKPTYQSRFTAYVNNKTENTTTLTSSDMSASQSLTNTYAELIVSRTALTNAAKDIELDKSYEQLRGAVSVSIASNTQIMTVRVVMDNYKEAYLMADALARTIPDYAADIIEGSSMKIIDNAVEMKGKYGPNYKKNTMIGFALGFVLMCGIVLIVALMDTKVKSQSALEDAFGYAVIGVIPDMVAAQKSGNGYYGYGKKKGE